MTDFSGHNKYMTTTQQELTDRQYDIADAIYDYLNAHIGQDFNASQLARVAKVPTHEVYPVLNHLLAAVEIAPSGRGGAWLRYTSRHAAGSVFDTSRDSS